MTIDTWVSLAALMAVLMTLGGLILTQGRSLRSDLTGDIARLDVKVDGLRTELKGDIDRLWKELKGDIGRLDDRVYALAAGLSPQIEQTQDRSASGRQDR